MYLDLRTLQAAAIVVCCVLGPVSLAFAPTQRYMRPSRYWGAGLIAFAAGLALVSLRGHAPDLVSQVLGPGLLALALTFMQSSARSAAGKDERDFLGWTLLGLFVLALLVQEKVSAMAWLREPLGMGALGLLCCRVAFGFDEAKRLPEGRALRAIGILFGIFGLWMILHGLLAPAASEASSEPEIANALMLVGLIAVLLMGTMLLMWVMTERINSKLRELVSLDPLTGALNRTAFVEQFEREAARSRRRSDARFAIMLIDIDQFHRVNDASGHPAGDRLLVELVGILRAMSRNYDLIGRLEGDVFALLTPGASGDDAMSIAERVRREVELQGSVRAGLANRVSVSIGIAVFGVHGVRWDTMLRAVDAALEQSKVRGGNRVESAVPIPHSPDAAPAAADPVPGQA